MRGVMAAVLLIAIGVGARTLAVPDSASDAVADGREKRRLVADYLQLAPAEAAGFWPLYERLQVEWRALQREREEHIRNFGRDFAGMTDALALEYTQERLRHEERRLRLLRQYLPRFQAVLPARKLARYYQIEDKIHAAIGAETAVEIPLIQ